MNKPIYSEKSIHQWSKIIVVASLPMVLVWILASLLLSSKTDTIKAETKLIITPIKVSFDPIKFQALISGRQPHQ